LLDLWNDLVLPRDVRAAWERVVSAARETSHER
jgi:hypothetical protein